MADIDLDQTTGFVLNRAVQGGGSDALVPLTTPDGSVSVKMPSTGVAAGYTALTAIVGINVDAQGRVVAFVAEDKMYTGVLETTATSSGQTFAFTHIVGQALVHQNGVLLEPSDYTEDTAGFTIPDVAVGDAITIHRFSETNSTGGTSYVPFTRTNINTVAGQTVYTSTYINGTELLYFNGVFLADEDYSYDSGANTFTLNFTPTDSTSYFTLISFRQFPSLTIPFTQAIGSSMINNTSVALTGTIANTTTNAMYANGVLLQSQSGSNDFTYSTSSNIPNGNITLSYTPMFSGNVFENTSFMNSLVLAGGQPVSAAAQSEPDGAAAASEYSEPITVVSLTEDGQSFLQRNNSTLISLGSLDPSADGRFDRISEPRSIADTIAALEARIKQLEGSQ